MNNLIGRVVSGRYRVDAFLGKGGMAEVYKVWDQQRSVFLAMKILHADLAEDKIFLRRFKREAQTLAKLQHPHIVRFYELEQGDDLVYILMEYVEGTNLRTEIFQSKTSLSAARILEIMNPICAALHFAHQSGFVHCDMKPANIMIDGIGKVYISDFGIARMTEAATMTMVGAGTPAYMAPELVRGETPVPQTDIYSLGVMLFEMLTGGERPFTGESANTTGSTSEKVRWEQMRLAAPPPSKYNSSLSPRIDEIVLKCLDKSLAKRYRSAIELYGDLAAQWDSNPVPPRKPAPSQPPLPKPIPSTPKESVSGNSKTLPFILLGLLVLSLACCALVYFQNPGGIFRAPTPTYTATSTNTLIPTRTSPPISTPTATFVPTSTSTFTPTFTLTPTATPSRAPVFVPTNTKTKNIDDGGGGGGGPIDGGG